MSSLSIQYYRAIIVTQAHFVSQQNPITFAGAIYSNGDVTSLGVTCYGNLSKLAQLHALPFTTIPVALLLNNRF